MYECTLAIDDDERLWDLDTQTRYGQLAREWEDWSLAIIRHSLGGWLRGRKKARKERGRETKHRVVVAQLVFLSLSLSLHLSDDNEKIKRGRKCTFHLSDDQSLGGVAGGGQSWSMCLSANLIFGSMGKTATTNTRKSTIVKVLIGNLPITHIQSSN